jgi:hypothetical protein
MSPFGAEVYPRITRRPIPTESDRLLRLGYNRLAEKDGKRKNPDHPDPDRKRLVGQITIDV